MSQLTAGLAAFESKDYIKAFELLKPIAVQGDAQAQCIVGNIYHLGLGLDCDVLEAMEWYKKSAEQGYGLAANNLAGIYLTGAPGIETSQVKAQEWYHKARQGFPHTPR